MSIEVEAVASGLSRGHIHELLTAAWAPPTVQTFGESSVEGARTPPAARLGIRGFGVGIRVNDRTGLGLADRLRALVPPDIVSGADGSFTTELFASTRVDGRIVLWSQLGSGSVEDPASALRWLAGSIDFTIATEATDAVFVHAGVVSWRGRAILVPGRSGTGKSSLVAALVRRGATYYSDELAPIDLGGRIHAYARIPTPRDGTPDPFEGLAPAGGERAAPGPPLPVAAILATTFRPEAEWHPRTERGARGLLPVIDNAFLCRERPTAVLRAARSISNAVTLVGPRGDADRVAPAILERVSQLIE